MLRLQDRFLNNLDAGELGSSLFVRVLAMRASATRVEGDGVLGDHEGARSGKNTQPGAGEWCVRQVEASRPLDAALKGV